MLAGTVGASMVDYRPYSLLLRLGIILLPILAGVLAWSYYHPLGSMLTPKAAVVIPAPAASKAPNPTELIVVPADAVAPADAPAAAATSAAVPARPVAPNTGAALGFAPDTQMRPTQVGPGARTAATMPALPGTKQQPVSGREPSKARDARKQEAASTHRTIQKLDNEVDRKLSICRGC
jgi:hypothetical protein